MGSILTLLDRLSHTSSYCFGHEEICFDIAGTYNSIGEERSLAVKVWEKTLRSMALCELRTRYLLIQILDDRVKYKQTCILKSSRALQFNELQKELPKWSEEEIIDFVELFETLDKKKKGLITPIALARWLDNLGDTTDYEKRVNLILKTMENIDREDAKKNDKGSKAKDKDKDKTKDKDKNKSKDDKEETEKNEKFDKTELIHLRMFLKLMYIFEKGDGKKSDDEDPKNIAAALRRGTSLIKKLRALNSIQQLSNRLV